MGRRRSLGRRVCLLLLLVVPMLAVAESPVPLELPSPTDLIPPIEDDRALGDVVLDALQRCQWRVRAVSGSSITADYRSGVHALRIRIDRSASRITFRYVDSEQLGYEEQRGERLIDPQANRWLHRLDEALRGQVARLRETPTPRVVPAVPSATGS